MEKSGNPRELRDEEAAIVKALMGVQSAIPKWRSDASGFYVTDLQDGMGSIRFVGAPGRTRLFGAEVATAEYIDDDGVLVSITANTDQSGELWEIDFWKVDFSSLKRYPKPSDLRIKK